MGVWKVVAPEKNLADSFLLRGLDPLHLAVESFLLSVITYRLHLEPPAKLD